MGIEVRNITLLNDTAQRANPGCQLTSKTLKAVLGQSATSNGWHVNIRSHPWGFAQRVNTADRALLRSLKSGHAFHQDALRKLSLAEYGLRAVADAIASDIVVFQPEGTISDQDDVLKILRLLSLPLYIANFERKPVIVMNGTFPLIFDERGALIHWLRESSTAFLMRDRMSADHWHGEFMPDTALTWSGHCANSTEYILISTGAEVPNETDRQLVLSALEVCRRSGAKPLVATKNWERFKFAEGQVKELNGEFYMDVDIETMDSLLMKCRLHIGGRYHMAILAATKGVPSVLIRTNTHKNEWLAQEFEGVSCCEIDKLVSEAAAMLEIIDRVGDGLITKTRSIAQSSAQQCTKILSQSCHIPTQLISAPAVPPDLRRIVIRDQWMVRKDVTLNIARRVLPGWFIEIVRWTRALMRKGVIK